ncbi:MAG TPA: hypothetical protein VG797_11205 [Phycisphaerales bacterium]|nr:hypothetical protein [Phycisphaerales bacterium]
MIRKNFLHGAVRLGLVGIGAIMACVGGASTASASLLSDSQLYFDPYSMTTGMYPYQSASLGGSVVFSGSPGREVVGANILPLLADNDYGSFGSYSFSQSDYSVQPNQPDGYAADLSFGTLTATFNSNGPYHVRVNYSDGTSEMNTVFVNSGIGDDPYGGGEAQARRAASPWKKVPAKGADLFIISNGAANDGFINSAAKQLDPENKAGQAGSNVGRASSVDDIVNQIERRKAEIAAAEGQARKIRVVIIGHGYHGSIRLGAPDNARRINNDGAATSTSGTDFGNLIKNDVSSVNLFGCITGGGLAGGRLLQDITNTGVPATAYDNTVGMTDDAWWAYTWATKAPTPGTLALMGMAGVLGMKRRR